MPYWFWFLTMFVGLVAIGASALVVVGMKISEIDRGARTETRRKA